MHSKEMAQSVVMKTPINIVKAGSDLIGTVEE